jgi:hypothetical protein
MARSEKNVEELVAMIENGELRLPETASTGSDRDVKRN